MLARLLLRITRLWSQFQSDRNLAQLHSLISFSTHATWGAVTSLKTLCTLSSCLFNERSTWVSRSFFSTYFGSIKSQVQQAPQMQLRKSHSLGVVRKCPTTRLGNHNLKLRLLATIPTTGARGLQMTRPRLGLHSSLRPHFMRVP
ncbi:hypothetical protein BJY52DRAFT_1332572 [Lactarius psammicola]|nr:hypothetical protein BJY52DRAFT_1332572 [Lactarius psammicola]